MADVSQVWTRPGLAAVAYNGGEGSDRLLQDLQAGIRREYSLSACALVPVPCSAYADRGAGFFILPWR